MTDDYTPSLNEVCADYVAIHTRNFDSYATGRSLTSEQEVYASRFDRWLASHDAEVAERIAQEIEADLMWDDLGRLNSFGLGQEYAVRLIRQIAARSHATAPSPEIPGFEGTSSALDGLTIRKEKTSD